MACVYPSLGMVPSPAAGVQGLNGSQVPLTFGTGRPGMLEELAGTPRAFVISRGELLVCLILA